MKSNWVVAVILAACCSAISAAEISAYDACLLDALGSPLNDTLTVQQVKTRCAESIVEPEPTGGIGSADEPLVSEVEMPRGFRDFFTPYKQNYILFGSMKNKDGGEPFSGKTLDIRFEFGMKFRMFQNREEFNRLSPLYFGYSQKSWWDIAESSAPFKEHNYNPEIFWDFEDEGAANGLVPYPLHDLVDRFGYEHQSNGRDGLASRSWDRFYAQRTFDFPDQHLQLKLKAWNVIGTDETNEDITDYLGNGEATLSYLAPSRRWELNASVMKGHETSKYSYRVDYISNMTAWLNSRFMLSYYDGYGEALISYNEKTRSLRAGIFVPVLFE